MKKHTILIVPFMVLLSGCATISSESNISFDPSYKDSKKFSSRPVPAVVTKESEDSLVRKGYVAIGGIESWEILKTCEGADCEKTFTCSNVAIQKDYTHDIIEKAASYGGDLIVLTKVNKIESDWKIKMGKCIHKKEGGIKFHTYDVRGREAGEYYELVCDKWESIKVYWCSGRSGGMLWRHEPELAKYIPLQKQYSKNFNDKYLPEEVTQPEVVLVESKYGFKDKSGKIVISPQFNRISARWYEGLRAVAIVRLKDDTWGFIDKTGKWVIQPSFDVRPGFFHEGLAAVSADKKWGFINRQGKYVIKPQFTAVNFDGFSDGLAAVSVDNKWGYVDNKGNFIIKTQYTNAKVFSEGLAAVSMDNKWGFIDKKGNIVILPQFDMALPFVKGIARVRVGDHWEFIEKSGVVVGVDFSGPIDDIYLLMVDPDEYGRLLREDIQRGLERANHR
jgi:hypothetical protein